MNEPSAKISDSAKRHTFIGGSDARIIMGDDEAALLRLWREKRGEAERADYSRNLLVQLGLATEALNRHWYERTTGEIIKDIQSYPCSFVRRMDFIRMAGVPDHRYKNAVYFCIAHIRESQIDSAKSETVIFGLCLGQLPHHSINGPSMKTGWTKPNTGRRSTCCYKPSHQRNAPTTSEMHDSSNLKSSRFSAAGLAALEEAA